jgi:hypothetical protein
MYATLDLTSDDESAYGDDSHDGSTSETEDIDTTPRPIEKKESKMVTILK